MATGATTAAAMAGCQRVGFAHRLCAQVHAVGADMARAGVRTRPCVFWPSPRPGGRRRTEDVDPPVGGGGGGGRGSGVGR